METGAILHHYGLIILKPKCQTSRLRMTAASGSALRTMIRSSILQLSASTELGTKTLKLLIKLSKVSLVSQDCL